MDNVESDISAGRLSHHCTSLLNCCDGRVKPQWQSLETSIGPLFSLLFLDRHLYSLQASGSVQFSVSGKVRSQRILVKESKNVFLYHMYQFHHVCEDLSIFWHMRKLNAGPLCLFVVVS